MKPLRLGFLTPLSGLVALAALGAVAAWMATRGAGMLSPGALSTERGPARGGAASHAELTCAACHPRPGSGAIMSDRCLACHDDVGAEIAARRLLHGVFVVPRACLACHTEHRGPDGYLTRADQVPHEPFGFSLLAHARAAGGGPLACASCHPQSLRQQSVDTCVACHDVYRPGFRVQHVGDYGDDCLACHDGYDRFSPWAFSHASTGFALTGRHRAIRCAACHPDTRALADFAGPPRECVGCHPEPDEHRGQFGTACGDCHSTDSWKGALFNHRFPMDHGHRRRRSPCKTCHPDSYRTYTCYGCHAHTPARIRRKHLKEGIRDYRECVRCHPTGREHEGRH